MLSQEIFKQLGRLEGQKLTQAPLRLRRTNQIKTIQASLSIEGNTLDLDQVTDILDGKRILGPEKDILEVKNAALVYEQLPHLNPLILKDLLKAHQILMQKLLPNAGDFRNKGVGIFKAGQVAHMAPPAKRVPQLMSDLFGFLKTKNQMSWLLKSCIFHYEFEFIHPFTDGNGRMGRLWQQLLLMKEHPVFEFVSVEEMIKKNQSEYYESLSISDKTGDSTAFVAFLLKIIFDSLSLYESETVFKINTPILRLQFSNSILGNRWFKRKDHLAIHKNISMATASRDLAFGLDNQILATKGTRNQILYQFNKPNSTT